MSETTANQWRELRVGDLAPRLELHQCRFLLEVDPYTYGCWAPAFHDGPHVGMAPNGTVAVLVEQGAANASPPPPRDSPTETAAALRMIRNSPPATYEQFDHSRPWWRFWA